MFSSRKLLVIFILVTAQKNEFPFSRHQGRVLKNALDVLSPSVPQKSIPSKLTNNNIATKKDVSTQTGKL